MGVFGAPLHAPQLSGPKHFVRAAAVIHSTVWLSRTVMIDRSQHSVLVVDDSSANRYATSRALRAAGFHTVEAAAGAEALELVDFVSAVVLDVHLPDLLGFEVCRLLRQRAATASLPVVHVSAVYVTQAEQVQGMEAGADAYMVAPVDPAALVSTLDRLIRERRVPAH